MLPFGEATSPSATTVPAGTGVSVGLGIGVAAGSAVARCEIAGFGVSVGVGVGVGVFVRAGWLCVACAEAFSAAGLHPASASVTATAAPIRTRPRRFACPVRADAPAWAFLLLRTAEA